MSKGRCHDPKALLGLTLSFLLVAVLTYLLVHGNNSRISLMAEINDAGEAGGAGQGDEAEARPAVHIRLATGDLLNYGTPLGGLLGGGFDKDDISLYVEKSQYRLTVLFDGVAVKQYPVCFGGNMADKLMQGDGCVPEGQFVIKALYPHESWSKFLWIDYPNADSWRKHDAAKAEGRIPSDAAIGGEVGIHGTGVGEDYLIMQGINYTAGCAGMLRSDVDEVYAACQAGTPILIVP